MQPIQIITATRGLEEYIVIEPRALLAVRPEQVLKESRYAPPLGVLPEFGGPAHAQ